MKFKSGNIFQDYFNSLKEDNEGLQTTRSSIYDNLDDFVSLKKIREQYETRSSFDDEYNEDDENGNEDEYRIASCLDLLPDSRFEHFLDTTLVVSVADTLYKITKDGTFFTIKGNKEDLCKISTAYNKDSLIYVGNKCYWVSGDIFLCDTYGTISGDTIDFEQTNEFEEQYVTRASTDCYYLGQTDSENDSMYGLKQYEWKSNSWGLLTSFFGLLGTDGTKDRKFDKKHRIQCRLYQLDYKFIETCGFKVKMERKKKFLCFSYWVEMKPENLVVGIEEMHGQHKLNFQYNNPLSIEDRGHYVDKGFGYVNNMIYAGYSKYSFLDDWLKQQQYIKTFYAGLKSFDILNLFKQNPWSYTEKLQKNAIYSGLKYLENQFLGNRIKNQVKLDANMALVFNGIGTLDSYVRGIEQYSTSSHNICFSSSGGISISFSVSSGGEFGKMKYSPFKTEKFTIKSIKIFGAAKYKGRWMGIRFYKNE